MTTDAKYGLDFGHLRENQHIINLTLSQSGPYACFQCYHFFFAEEQATASLFVAIARLVEIPSSGRYHR